MANIDGIVGYNSPSGVNKLLAAYGNDIVDVTTGLGYGLNLTAGNKAFFEVFIDKVFFTNGVDKMRSFDGTSWSDSSSLPRFLIPKYIKKSVNNAQLLAANCILTPGGVTALALNYRSYVFKSNFPRFGKSPNGQNLTQALQWGLESGSAKLRTDTQKLQATLELDSTRLPYLVSGQIKVGDPLFIVDSLGGAESNVGQYTVAAINSEYELTLNEVIRFNGPVDNVTFWVGSNWFPVGTDDNDQIMGLGENDRRDLIFKLFSLWVYTSTQLYPVKGAVGTSSARSIINDRRGNTYYFHGSSLEKTGIYKFDGVNSVRISRAIEPFIQGMSSSNYSEVVAWEEGDELRFFIGDLSNNNENISMSNAVATINTATGAWDVSPIADVVKCATSYIVSNVQNTYVGTNDDQILKMNSGFMHNGRPISAVLETKVVYPGGSELINEYPYIQVVSKNATGIRLSYKLWDQPSDRKGISSVSDRWIPLGELHGDLTEFEPKLALRRSSGIQFRAEESGNLENNWLIEKISIFYRPDRTRLT